ncbi:MAG: hypothetical protein FWE34_03490 [Defluviitaleaceae bacterium]|nr:hypothetical protein [Defluviitaleaceae bacterium]
MKKSIKVLVMTLAMLLVLGLMAACGGGNDNNDAPADTTTPAATDAPATPAPADTTDVEPAGIDLSETVTITVTRRGGARDVNQHDYFAEYVLERFNVIFEVTDIPNADYITRMNLMFASGDEDHVSIAHRPDFMLNDWVEQGHLRGFTRQELEMLMPNYIEHWNEVGPDVWDIVWNTIMHSDGLAYYLPHRRPHAMNMSWMYRADLFEELNLEFPDTIDELIPILHQLQAHTGGFPIVEADPDGPIWAFQGWMQIFGMPELGARDLSMIHPVTGEFEPYIFTTDAFRRYTSFLNYLHDSGLMWPEFITGTAEQRNSLQSRNNRFVQWGWPEQIPTIQNELSQEYDPNARWEWATVMLTEDPANGHFFKRDPFHTADGVGISIDAPDYVVERWFYFMNWLYSDEGMTFNSFGIEGTHFEWVGDERHFLDHMTNPADPGGYGLVNFGFVSMAGGLHHPDINRVYRPWMIDLHNTFYGRDNYFFHLAPIMRFTAEETRELAQIQTLLNQTRDEYFSRFIVGQIDINNDAHWQEYIDTMNALGLDRFKEIRSAAFERSN